MSKKGVYLFREGNATMRDLLGGKGANLAEMTNIGLPVPPGFTITTEVCNEYIRTGKLPGGLMEQVRIDGVEHPGDLRVGARLVLHDLRGAQHRPPVDDRDLRRELGEEDRLLHRRVAAADDGDLVAAEKVAVAGGAGRDAVAHQRALSVQAQQAR